jgi:hypothetical protein
VKPLTPYRYLRYSSWHFLFLILQKSTHDRLRDSEILVPTTKPLQIHTITQSHYHITLLNADLIVFGLIRFINFGMLYNFILYSWEFNRSSTPYYEFQDYKEFQRYWMITKYKSKKKTPKPVTMVSLVESAIIYLYITFFYFWSFLNFGYVNFLSCSLSLLIKCCVWILFFYFSWFFK